MKWLNTPFKKGVSVVLLLIAVQACSNYYRVSKKSNITAVTNAASVVNTKRYFILRSGSSAYYMNNIVLSKDRQSLTCSLQALPKEHTLHLHNGRGGTMRFKIAKPEAAVVNEVHLYIPWDSTAVAGKSYSLSLNRVMKIEVLEKDKGRTTLSYVLGGLAITGGAILVAGIIVVATKSSCPFVSAYDGNNMVLQGEIYGGAIYPQLARNDYMELKMAPAPNGNLQLQISNELKEKQYTDLAELMVVTHNKDVRIMVDENGKLYSVARPVLPDAATVGNKDVLPLLSNQKDDQYYSFDDTLTRNGINQLRLTFNKPVGSKKAKLVLRLKNSYWLDVTYGKMTMGFGRYYNDFIKQQYNKPVADLKQWVKKQELPLHIELNTNTGWQSAADITTFGPLANRETVIPLDLANVKGNSIDLQLSTGFMFWDIDYAAIDFSDDANYQVSTLRPLKATDETGKDVTQLITNADGKYMGQLVPGNAAVIEYKFKPQADINKTQTYFLHARGYYEHVRDYKGGLDLPFLGQFKKRDGLSAFSMKLYKETMTGNPQPILSSK